ncbi:MAG: tetratricopeptide repeat protein [Candidatus Obscuribacterales bacterium]|jgi:tetratricopeptide (TPR) repeat protein|nr:tetratricopeptide repeat protein [Candidatus Obscuribacterales bacterium]
MPRSSSVITVTAAILLSTACSSNVNMGAQKLSSLKRTETKSTTVTGERYDPAVDEIVTNGSLKAWRVALRHDKSKEELGEAAWLKARVIDEAESMKQLTQLAERYPKASFLKTMMGQVKQHFGKKEEAALYYQEALVQNRGEPLLIFKLARAKEAAGHREEAIGYYRDVIKLQPDFTPAQLGLASCLAREASGRQEAQTLAHAVLKIEPQNKDAAALVAELGKSQTK